VLDQNYIGGRWVASGSATFLDVLDPTTEQIIGRVADSTESDINLAVRQAREAFPRLGRGARLQPGCAPG
jgi:aldehyde dehydrogenase (NAD+)